MAEFRTSIEIEAPPEIVFAHLVTPQRMITWMGERADLEPRPGGRFAVDIGGVPFRGEYVEVDEPRRVVVSWGLAGSDEFPPGASRVEFTLEPTARGTTLHLLHSGLPESHARTHAAGWAHYLGRLQLAAYGRVPGPDPGFSTTLPLGRNAEPMNASELVSAYYASWTNRFDEDRLRSILAQDLVFEGPLAGHRVGAEGFIRGVHDVARSLKAFDVVQRLDQGEEVAVLYDCELTRPAGTHRFAEFFTVENGRIAAIRLMYDGTEWRKLATPQPAAASSSSAG